MEIIDKILCKKEFQDKPPVLIDIGAAGRLPEIWKDIGKHSVCIAFDADDREMGYVERESKNYKKLYVYPRILINTSDSEAEFYLTKSPHCSSLLRPLNQELTQWAFADLFAIDKRVSLKAINLQTVLQELDLDRVDWFKTDSQGTDLRLFKSLGDAIIQKVLVADFEPGIIDAYEGEDKLWQLMSFMERSGFWMSDINIKGSQRIRADILKDFNKFERRYISQFIKTSPGWGEATYINNFNQDVHFSKRDLLLGWVFSSIKQQHGFALQIANEGYNQFCDAIFLELRTHTMQRVKRSYIWLPAYFIRRLVHKLYRMITKK